MTDRAVCWTLLLLAGCSLGAAQGLSPSTPAKEYIRLNGQVVAVEQAVPGGAIMRENQLTEKRAAPSATKAATDPAIAPPLSFVPPGARWPHAVLFRLPLPVEPPQAPGNHSASAPAQTSSPPLR